MSKDRTLQFEYDKEDLGPFTSHPIARAMSKHNAVEKDISRYELDIAKTCDVSRVSGTFGSIWKISIRENVQHCEYKRAFAYS